MRVLLNCAVDAKGRLAGPGGKPVRLSSDADMKRVHGLRASCDAIMVGVETVLADDPGLRVKPEYAKGKDPLRVVLDSRLRITPSARLLSDGAATRIYHSAPGKVVGAETVEVPAGPAGVSLPDVLYHLAESGVRSVLVEGGSRVLQSFVEASLFDLWTVFQSPLDVGDGPALWDGLPREGSAGLRLDSKQPASGGILWTFSPG